MPARIETLIEGRDNFELIRDEVAAILALEVEQQQHLAVAAGKNPRDWRLRVFVERSSPWGMFEHAPDEELEDASPIVNVSLDNAATDLAKSNLVDRQLMVGVYNLDCIGYGVSRGNLTGGHTPGDEHAAAECHRAARLVRRILMAAHYISLGHAFRGIVARRWIQTVQIQQPAKDDAPVQHVLAARLALHVEFNEFSPQVQGQPLELLSATAQRAGTGQVYFNASYVYGASP